MQNFKPITAREKVLRCVTLSNLTTCEKRKQRIEMIKENIIAKENARVDKYLSNTKVKEMLKNQKEINLKYLQKWKTLKNQI